MKTPLRRPIKANVPHFGRLHVDVQGRAFALPYFIRKGSGPAVLFLHGLGGAKENFYAALQSRDLDNCTLVSFDQPGTGQAEFAPDAGLDVSALADIAHAVAAILLPGPYFLAGASMGGLISLLQIRRHGIGRIQGLINLEGNLCPEDCLFSRRVVEYELEAFSAVFDGMMEELRRSPHLGDCIIAQNMDLNLDVRAYHAYSFQTVAESDSGLLLEEFLALPIPRLFLYGEANGGLSYLPRLRESSATVVEIPDSAHFLFYDNPVATFRAIGEFIRRVD